MVIRNKTPPEYIYHGLYLYFSGLSLRRTSQQLSYFIKRNHVTIWNWIQKYHPQRISSKSKRISEFIIDETLFKVGSEYIWLWVAIEPKTSKFSHYQSQKRETCLLLKDLFQVWSQFMESIRFPQMEEHGIRRPADS